MVSLCLADAIRLAHRFPDGTVEIRAVTRQVLRHAAHCTELVRRAGEDTHKPGPLEITHAAVASSDARVVEMLKVQATLGDGQALTISLVEWDQLAIGTVNHHHFAAQTGPPATGGAADHPMSLGAASADGRTGAAHVSALQQAACWIERHRPQTRASTATTEHCGTVWRVPLNAG